MAWIADEVAAQFFPTDPPQFYRVAGSYNKIDPIKDSLSVAGFIDLRIAVLAREKQVADIGAFARAMVYGNPLIDMIRARGGVDPDQVVDALGEAFAREFGNPGGCRSGRSCSRPPDHKPTRRNGSPARRRPLR